MNIEPWWAPPTKKIAHKGLSMSDYRRARKGNIFFFTMVTYKKQALMGPLTKKTAGPTV